MVKPILFLLLSPFMLVAQNTDTLLYEQFETGGASFTLNTTDLNSVTPAVGYNEWVVNNAYTGGTGTLICLGIPNSFTVPNTPAQPAGQTGGTATGYLHLASDAALLSGIMNSSYLAASGLCGGNENYFAGMAQDIVTTGYDSVNVSFLWLCSGAANNYGEMYYSIDGGSTWTQITSPVAQFNNNTNWTTCSVTLPVFTGQPTLRFGFRFVNQITFTASDPAFSIDEFLITAIEAVGPPIAQFGVSDSILCAGDCVDYTDLSVGSAPSSWLWIFQGSSTSFSSSENPTGICYPTPGTYTTTLIVTSATGTDTLTMPAVTVHALPPVPSLTVSGDTLFAPPGYGIYQWYADGVLIPNANSDTLVVLAGGAYTVTITDSTGCTATSLPVLMTTGLYEASHHHLTIFPNPFIDELYIHYIHPEAEIEISDLTGRIILRSRLQDGKMSTSHIPGGTYLLRIVEKDGNLRVARLVKN
jgi:hypothetical protein